jgi:phage repressor protein C with HTH and peptisase S24 domain
MIPTLVPGDRVLVVAGFGPFRPRLRLDDIVALVDPRDAERTMIKRIAAFEGGGVVVRGDNEAQSVNRHALRGRVAYRYHPESRRGRLGPGPRR